MKQETKEYVRRMIDREELLIAALNKKPDDVVAKDGMQAFKQEKEDWLFQEGGLSDDMIKKDRDVLEKKVSLASRSITRAANERCALTAFREEHSHEMPIEPYYRITEDQSQVIALAENYAVDRVRDIERFNIMRKFINFLNIAICKFKRPKKMQQENESQAPTKE